MSSFEIDIPIKAMGYNHAHGYRAFGKRVISYMTKEAKAYQEVIRSRVPSDWKIAEKDVSIMIELGFRDNRKHDLDKHLPLIIDALNGTAYKDDSQIKYIFAYKHQPIQDFIKIKVITATNDNT